MQKLNKNLIATVTTTSLIVGLCAPAAIADADVTGGYDGWDTVVRRETSTPGGFSSVAEPAGPVDPEAAAIYAATYQFACVIIPNLLSHATGGKPVTVHEMCTAQANTGAPLAAGPTTVSNEQVARLIPHGSGINRYPSGEVFVIFKQPMMVWTSPDKQTFNITLLGTAIEVEATPVSFNWDWGDGQSFETTDHGTPYPNYTVSHAYEVTGNGYVITNYVLPGRPGGA